LIAIILTVSMSGTLFTASAHSPPWTITSYAFMSATPNPVGVGQAINIYMWVDHAVPGATEVPGSANTIRRENYQLTITAPDGKVTTQTFAYIADPTGFQAYTITAAETGTYSFEFNYPAQTYVWTASTPGASTAYTGDVFTAASYGPINVTVGQTQVSTGVPTPALPTAYWTYPIFGTNWNWYTVASNYLEAPYIVTFGGHSGAIQPDGAAPTTAHMMWTQPIQFGGIVGGNDTNIPGEGYYQGGSYNIRFGDPIIMNGILFFQLPFGEAGTGGNYVAWNMETGQQLWSINPTPSSGPFAGITLVPSFGYLPTMDQPNQAGILPDGLLIAQYSIGGFYIPGFGSFGGTPAWAGYDPMTGVLTSMNVTNIPSGDAVMGPGGQYLIISLVDLAPKNAYGVDIGPPVYYLQEWNSTKVFGQYLGTGTSYWYSGSEIANIPLTPAMPTTAPASGKAWSWTGTAWAQLPSASALPDVTPAYDWNISVSPQWSSGDSAWAIGGSGGIFGATAGMINLNHYIVLTQGTFGAHVGDFMSTPETYNANITEISLAAGANGIPSGAVNWWQTYPQAPGNLSRIISAWDPTTGVFIFWDQESLDHYGYSLSTGAYMWGPVYPPATNNVAWMYTGDGTSQDNVAYGTLYWTGYDGDLYAFNDKTGALLWTFGNGNTPDNSTAANFLPYGQTPMFIATIADGMVYTISSEHSPNSPLYPNYKVWCVNATTGLLVWSNPDYGNQMYGGNMAIASGYGVVDDTYDQQIDCYGQGPSATTVTAPNIAATVGVPVVIRGTVMDISAGTKQAQQAADFPSGVPVASDAMQSAWMQYVYMQQPEPTTFTGVPVTVSVRDSNGNTRVIGQAMTDENGAFSLSWAPDIPGNFTVVASFAGSGAYYGSTAETSFYAQAAAPTPAPTATPQSNLVSTSELTMYIAVAIIVIIIALAVATVLLLRKRP